MLLDVIARSDVSPDEARFLEQLQAAIAGIETPANQLFARYCGRSGTAVALRSDPAVSVSNAATPLLLAH